MSRTSEDARDKVRSLLERTVSKNKDLRHGLLCVYSDRLRISWKFASGTTGKDPRPISEDQPYHIASIGKIFTSALIAKLYEEGNLDYDDPIGEYLSGDILNGLHLYRGKSYSDRIRIRQLLNHTSGLPDYFEDKPAHGKSVLEHIVEEPDRFWTPQETIQHAKDNLKAHFPPGEGFHYGDTGYQLLGLVIENITGRPMHEGLHRHIFDPLGMEHTCQLFYSKPRTKSLPMADVYLNRTEISAFQSVSADWAGGGIVSNTSDLLRFHRALVNHTLLRKETRKRWEDWARFGRGIDYGYGLVSLKFRELTLLLPDKLNMWGNWGSTSTFLFYNPHYDVYLTGAFNQSNFIRRQVPFLIRVMNIVKKLPVAG